MVSVQKVMEKPSKPLTELAKKRKRKSNGVIKTSEPKNKKLDKKKPVLVESTDNVPEKKSTATKKAPLQEIIDEDSTEEEINTMYPILKDTKLIERYLKVPINNNQKGRIKQAINLQLKSSNNTLNSDAINGKIQAIIQKSEDLTDSELRRIRILFNMLRNSLKKDKGNDSEKMMVDKPKEIKMKNKKNADTNENAPEPITVAKPKKNKKKTEIVKDKEVVKENGKDIPEEKEKKEQLVNKVKGPKRYVVFVGNLPVDVTEDTLMEHFSELRDRIKDVRIPKASEKKKSGIAFIELSDEPTYESALSKHHTMFKDKRINVLYSTQQNSKISKAEAKSKTAKLVAMQKAGKLLGSVPLAKKRSQRRLKMKKAQETVAA